MSACDSAPGKAILVGEHAVVYGLPAIAIPLAGVRARASSRAADQPLTIFAEDLPRPPLTLQAVQADPKDPLALMAWLTMRRLGVERVQGEIRISSEIPIASGLGSGAAVSAALGRAIARMLSADISDDDLSRLVFEVEKLHHGTPSGIDNTVVVHEKPLYFVKDRPPAFVDIASPLRFVLADSGIAALTRDAVADVRALRQSQPAATARIFAAIGEIVNEARGCIERGDRLRLGELMTANHRLLGALSVSSAALDRLVAAALKAGALGAKLSGGGRGGVIVALSDEDAVDRLCQALYEAGAKRVMQTVAGPGSHHDDAIA